MWSLFDMLKHSAGSIFGGFLIAICCWVLFAFIIKGWYKDAVFSPVSYIIGVTLFLFLSIQCILIVGSFKIIHATDYYEVEISRIVDNTYDATDEVTLGQADKIIQGIIKRFPLLHYYIDENNFSGYTAKELPHAIADELRSFMRWYIFRRILWCLGFVIIGAICVIKSLSKQYKPSRIIEKSSRQRVNIARRRVRKTSRR